MAEIGAGDSDGLQQEQAAGQTEAEEIVTEEPEGGFAESCNVSNAGEGDLGSEFATGSGEALSIGEDQQLEEDGLSDVSETGWETDLEIEEEKEKFDHTGRKEYIKTCEMLNIIPVSHFLRCLQAEQSAVDLSHHNIGSKGTKAISITLMSNTTITHLNLSDNALETEGGIAIADMLKENCYITHLDLSNNSLTSAGAFALAEVLTSNGTVTFCNFSGNKFDDKAAEPIGQVIKGSFRITHLDLSHNEFSEPAGAVLGGALAESEVLQKLDLSWNQIRRKGAVAIAQGLKSNTTLKSLNLAYNGFGAEGAKALQDALKLNSTLMELDIIENRIPPQGAMDLAKVIPNCESLKVLKIGRNPIEMSGVTALLTALKSGAGSVKHLGLDGITVTLEVASIIKDMENDIAGLCIPHGGTGGYREPKPMATAMQKLTKYSVENKVNLNDLFLVFDKERLGYLDEENFRAALKHISAPLMGFEVLKLIQQFRKEGVEQAPQDGDKDEAEPKIFIDYNLITEAAVP